MYIHVDGGPNECVHNGTVALVNISRCIVESLAHSSAPQRPRTQIHMPYAHNIICLIEKELFALCGNTNSPTRMQGARHSNETHTYWFCTDLRMKCKLNKCNSISGECLIFAFICEVTRRHRFNCACHRTNIVSAPCILRCIVLANYRCRFDFIICIMRPM